MSRGHQAQPCATVSALVGIIFGSLCAAFWILYTHHLVETVQVAQGPEHWIESARTKAYGVCFDGCSECLDVDSIENACRMTTKVDVSGTVCDASEMWTWVDRYPIECLEAVGEIYKSGVLWWKKFWRRALYIFVILSLPLGFIGYLVTDCILQHFNNIAVSNRRPRVQSGRRNSNSTTPLLAAAALSLLALSLPTPAAAYACMNYHPVHNQLFANADNTLYGVVHGWLSNCWDNSYSCGESCGQSHSCSTVYCTVTETDKGPADFVRVAARHVTQCGFRLVDVVPGVVDRRIANPRIEKNLWVKVAVNRFNGSEGLEEQVECLYGMVEAPKW